MAKENNPSTEEILQKLASVFSPEKKAKKEKRNRILMINGRISENMVSMKEAKRIAKQLSVTDAIIQTYVLEGTLSTNLEVEVQ